MQIELLSNTAFGKVGDIVNVSAGVGERMIRNRDAKAVAAPAKDEKRFARPLKVRPENKSVGA